MKLMFFTILETGPTYGAVNIILLGQPSQSRITKMCWEFICKKSYYAWTRKTQHIQKDSGWGKQHQKHQTESSSPNAQQQTGLSLPEVSSRQNKSSRWHCADARNILRSCSHSPPPPLPAAAASYPNNLALISSIYNSKHGFGRIIVTKYHSRLSCCFPASH